MPNRDKERIPLAGIGFSPVEALPLYHYHPGGLAVRLLVACGEPPPFSCDYHLVCPYSRGLKALEPVDAGLGELVERVRVYRPDLVVFEGPNPLSCIRDQTVTVFQRVGISVALRSFGTERISVRADVVILDDIHAYSSDPSLRVDFLDSLSHAVRGRAWVEVNTYMEEPREDILYPLLHALRGSRVPLHIHVRHHMGGGPIRSLYTLAKRYVSHVYIHNREYPYLDTYCPSCGKPVAMREEGVLLDLETRENGTCWNCGNPVPFYGRIRKKTPPSTLILVGGGKWVHPLQLARINSFFNRTSARRSSGSRFQESRDG